MKSIINTVAKQEIYLFSRICNLSILFRNLQNKSLICRESGIFHNTLHTCVSYYKIPWQPDSHREGTSYPLPGDALGSFGGWALGIITNTNMTNACEFYFRSWPGFDTTLSNKACVVWADDYFVFIYLWNLQFLNNASINKPKVILPHVYM